MKSSLTALNPYAQSYVPLAKRETKNEDGDTKSLFREAAVSDSSPPVDDLKLKGQQVDVSLGAPSQSSQETDSKFSDEESEMDLAYLQLMFPGVSDQSLLDVYNVNRGDLEAAVDMLNVLESADDFSDGSSIGSPQDPVASGECSSVKVLNVTGEPSSSSSASVVAVPT